jgi:eukaryotic-like serine/threonine-protein kinase
VRASVRAKSCRRSVPAVWDRSIGPETRGWGRDVALKTLPESFTHAPERLARFRREAQMLASLNHPHIGAIYGLEEVAGQQVLVLEFVDGETLADRIARGPIPFEDAVVLATQIAEALEAAHEKGIIHRDLKPANIALTKEGAVKVLDFGLAKAADTSGAAQLDMPTLTSPALMSGQDVILGTAAYMSPEQAKGRAADKRSDAWAFGCVVYEMLTGRRPFGGDEVSDTLASVLRDEPDWRALPAAARPFASVLHRLLEKDPARRLRDMSDVKLLMTDAEQRSAPEVSVASRSRRWWIVAAAAVGVAVGLVSAALVLPWRGAVTPAPRVERFALASAAAPFDPALRQEHRDFSGRLARRVHHRLIVPLSTGRAVDRPGGGHDTRQHGRRQRSVLVGGRPADRVRDARRAETGSGGRRVKYQNLSHLGPVQRRELGPGRLHRLRTGRRTWIVPSPGRWRRTGTHRGAGRVEGRAQLPPSHGSSGRRSVLYTVALSGGQSRIVARRLAGGDAMTVAESGFGAEYLASGHLLYAQDQRLMAVPFDVATLRTTGSPVPVQEDVSMKPLAGVANVVAAGDGTVVFVSGGLSRGPRHVVWVDRRGTQTRALEEPLEFPRYPRLSPDGARLAITTGPSVEGNVWVHDLSGASRPPLKLTFENHNLFPIWSPDGKRILFITRGRTNSLNAVAADGSSLEPEMLATNGEPQVPLSWCPEPTSSSSHRSEPKRAPIWSCSR